MQIPTYDDLLSKGLISVSTRERIRKNHSLALFSLHWELKILLYTGVMLLSTGLGILIYKNIDSISHQVILTAIAVLSAGCFYWCNKYKAPFSYQKVPSPGSFSDYILLLGTLSFLTFVGYLQYQYEVFGTHYGLATFIPMLVLFFIGYYFDHRGALTMAIANLAIWMGVSVTPKKLLASTTFNSETIIYTYLALGLILLIAAIVTERFNIKKHFFFSYFHYGVHLTFISLLSGYFFYDFGISMIWLAAFALAAAFIYNYALKIKSFYFLMVTIVYSYIAISGLAIRMISRLDGEIALNLGFLYFIMSGILFVNIVMNINKKLKLA